MALVEALNAVGVSLSANSSSSPSQQVMGSNLTIAALAIQLFVIVIFVLLAGIFHRRCAKASIHTSTISTPLRTLYTSMALILIRCIYRLVEHMGNTTVHLGDIESLKNLSPILRYEWFFYIFEGTLMLLNSILWNVWSPGRYLPANRHVYLSRDGRTEVQGEYSDDRPLLAVVGSVLTFGVLFREKKKVPPFEELNDYPPTRQRP